MKLKTITLLIACAILTSLSASEALAADTLIRRDVYRSQPASTSYDPTSSNSFSSTVPAGAEYAVVRLWGGAGGPYGNDNMLILTPSAKNVPGGNGGFVSGRIDVGAGDKITGALGAPGANGRRGGDNNDTWGTHGKKSTVVVDGKEVMVAGGGASVAFSVNATNGTWSYIQPSPNVKGFLDGRRQKYSDGGSPYAGQTKAAGVTDTVRSAVIKKFIPYIGSVGGTGKKNGDYYVWPWYNGYHHLNMTGGTSYINTSVVKAPVYYSGNPANNPSDGGAWKKYFDADARGTRPATSGDVYAGGGATVIEYWATQDVRDVCLNVSGVQTSVPSGMTLGSDGLCVTIPVIEPVCTASAPETRSISCSGGQAGSITERRVSTCPGPVWGSWTAVSNTCSSAATNTPVTGGSTTTTPQNPPVPVTPSLSVAGPSNGIQIRFFGGGAAVSSSAGISVNRSNPASSVTLSISGQAAFENIPSDVTASYSFDGASFDSGSVSKVLPSGTDSSSLKLRLSKALPNACGAVVSSGCVDYAITITASAPGASDASVRVRVIQSVLSPAYEES